MLYPLMRSLLFCLPPETAHKLTLNGLATLNQYKLLPQKQTLNNSSIDVMGLTFPNRVGLAAGFDKNGKYLNALAQLGFGHIEVGTVTPKPQPGNPKPRLFRLPKARALINRMGFNNDGVDALIHHIEQSHYQGILGINIGKNKTTPLDQAVEDYLICLHKVYPYASYITINISSPNTENLRKLQHHQALDELLHALKAAQQPLATKHQRYVPLVVKIAPDLTLDAINQIAQLLLAHQIDGVIATNTSVMRNSVQHLKHATETGGLSGAPLTQPTIHTIQQLQKIVQNKIAIIAVGGILSKEDAQAMFNAGADLIQLYTGLIYRGPGLIADITKSAICRKPAFM